MSDDVLCDHLFFPDLSHLGRKVGLGLAVATPQVGKSPRLEGLLEPVTGDGDLLHLAINDGFEAIAGRA